MTPTTTTATTQGEHTGGGLRGAVAAEWTKLWSVRSTWWCLAAAVALTLGYAVLYALALRFQGDTTTSLPEVSAGGVFYLVQFALICLAILLITTEYASGGIRSSLQCVPVRTRLLAGKAAVLVPVLFLAGVVLSTVAMGVAAALRDGPDPGVTQFLAATVATGAYLALLGLFCLGLGLALRSTAGTLTVVFVLLLMAPMLVGSLGSVAVVDYFPGFGGLNAMVPTGQPNPVAGTVASYPRWIGLLVTGGWAGLALLTGSGVFQRRDA